MAVGDDDGLEDFPEGVVEAAEPLAGGLPGEAPDEELGVGGVPEGRGGEVQPRAGARRRRRAGRRARVLLLLLLQSHLARSGDPWRGSEGILAGRDRAACGWRREWIGAAAAGVGRGESGAEWKEKVGGDNRGERGL